MVATEVAIAFVILLALLILLLLYFASLRAPDPNGERQIVGSYVNWADWQGHGGMDTTLRGQKEVRTVKGKGSTRPKRTDEGTKGGSDDA